MSTAGRDIISAAKVELAEGSSAKASQSRVARASGLSATSTLQGRAGRDVTLTGSALLTGGDASITAGHDLTVGSAVTFMERHAKRLDESSTTNHASVVGSNLTSGKDLTVAASGNVSVASAQTTSYYSEKKSSTGTLGFSSSAKASGSSSVTQVASTLTGQNISLDAGKSAGIAASNFIAQQNLSLTARDGDVCVLDAANQSASWSYKKQTGFGLGSSDTFSSFYGTEGKKQQNTQSTSVASNLTAGQDITVASSRDTSVVGSNLSAGNNVTINAGRDANILGGTNTSSSNTEKFTLGFGVEGQNGSGKMVWQQQGRREECHSVGSNHQEATGGRSRDCAGKSDPFGLRAPTGDDS